MLPQEKKVTFLPMPGKVVVELDTRDRVGTLYVPVNSQQSRSLGKIIAIGNDEEDGTFYDLKVGDIILFGHHAGVKTSVERQDVLVLNTREILTRLVWSDGEGGRVEVEDEHLDHAHVEDSFEPDTGEVIELREQVGME